MRILSTAILSLILSVAPTFAAAAEEARAERGVVETIDGYVRNRGFNGVVLVAGADGAIVHQARGVSSLELGSELDPSAVFRIGSLTKPITAVLVLSLVNEGRLRLDGSLGEYLPDIYADTPAGAVTFEQLLAHTSGLKDVPGNYNDPFWRTTARQTFTPEAFARSWILPELSSEPGKWRYNNNASTCWG